MKISAPLSRSFRLALPSKLCRLLGVIAATLTLTYQAQAQSRGYWVNDHLEYNGEHRKHNDDYPYDGVIPWDWRNGLGGSGDHQVLPYGVAGSTVGSGQVRPWFRWVRRMTYIPQPGGGYTYGPDPNDNPPESLVIAVTGGGYGNAASDYTNGQPLPGPNRMIAKEHVTVSIFDQTIQGTDQNGSTYGTLSVSQLKTIPAKSAMQTDAQGNEVLAGPWLPLSTNASLDGGRYINQTQNSSGTALGGYVGSGLSFTSEPQNYYAVLPNPLGVALAPCPDPTPQTPLNQYVMLGSGGVFTIPCVVTYTGSDSTFYSRLVNGLDWSITRPITTMLVRAANKATSSTGPCEFSPQHTAFANATPQPSPITGPLPTPTPVPTMSGLAFLDKLPASNSVFGVNSIKHKFEGKTFATSHIAVFYESGAYTHPANGNVDWCNLISANSHKNLDYGDSHDVPYTPNWFYYYSQSWELPYHLSYDPNGYEGQIRSYYGPGDDHIHISDDCHGYSNHRLWEKRTGHPFVVQVGHQETYGIDTFFSIATHEVTHKTLYNMIISGEIDDEDEDGLPDPYEESNNLDMWISDSTGLGSTYPEYALIADQEVYCHMAQRDVLGPREEDWADDGLNFGRVPGGCSTNRSPKFYYSAPVVPPV